MALQNVSREGKWTSSVSTLNNNFQSLSESLGILGKDLQRSKGLYPSLSALRTAYPSPEDGSWAYVGASFPATIYIAKGGSWISSGYSGNLDVDLEKYLKSETINSGSDLFTESIAWIFSNDGGSSWNNVSKTKRKITPVIGDNPTYIVRPSSIKFGEEGELLRGTTSDAYLKEFIPPASFVSAKVTSSDDVTKEFTSGSLSWTINKDYYYQVISGTKTKRPPVAGDSLWIELVYNSKNGFRNVIRQYLIFG